MCSVSLIRPPRQRFDLIRMRCLLPGTASHYPDRSQLRSRARRLVPLFEKSLATHARHDAVCPLGRIEADECHISPGLYPHGDGVMSRNAAGNATFVTFRLYHLWDILTHRARSPEMAPLRIETRR